jgi:hypothetical protein
MDPQKARQVKRPSSPPEISSYGRLPETKRIRLTDKDRPANPDHSMVLKGSFQGTEQLISGVYVQASISWGKGIVKNAQVLVDLNLSVNLIPRRLTRKLGLSTYSGGSVSLPIADIVMPREEYCVFNIEIEGARIMVTARVVANLPTAVLGQEWARYARLLFGSHTYYFHDVDGSWMKMPGINATAASTGDEMGVQTSDEPTDEWESEDESSEDKTEHGSPEADGFVVVDETSGDDESFDGSELSVVEASIGDLSIVECSREGGDSDSFADSDDMDLSSLCPDCGRSITPSTTDVAEGAAVRDSENKVSPLQRVDGRISKRSVVCRDAAVDPVDRFHIGTS